jgi:DNA-binding beta-propeller fold protein YncE
MSRRRIALALAVLVGLPGLAGCEDRDPLQVGSPSMVSAAAAPSPTAAAAGRVWPVPRGTGSASRPAEGIAVAGGRVAVGLDRPPQLAVVDADTGRLLRTVRLTRAPSHVVALPDGGFRVVAGRELVTVPVRGRESRVRWSPEGHALAVLPDGGTAVTFPREGTVAVYGADGELRRAIRTRGHPDGIAADGNRIGVIDARATSLTVYRADTGEREQGLRAGNGARHLVADRTGRFLVADTRDGELLVYATDPLYLRQRYPVAGSPYGMAYDPSRNVVWLTLTGRNEVVGLDVTGGAPKIIARHPTVWQPNSVAVDPGSGTVFVASKAEGLVQSIPR